jgi:CheY-like chemotaxis protein
MYLLAGNKAQRACLIAGLDGVEYVEVSSALEVLLYVRTCTLNKDNFPDFIIMPYKEICGMGGLAALQRLRERNILVPVLLIVNSDEINQCRAEIAKYAQCDVFNINQQ